jgi:hypothetical protein
MNIGRKAFEGDGPMALARDPLPESAFQPRRVPNQDDDGSGRSSVMMVVFVALLAAAFVCATLNAGVQNEPATQTEPDSTNSTQ